MEMPESWDLLSASLAVCDLGIPETGWEFLLAQKLVTDGNESDKREIFMGWVDEYYGKDITGPSWSSSIADALVRGLIIDETRNVPDPCGCVAEDRWNLFQEIKGQEDAKELFQGLGEVVAYATVGFESLGDTPDDMLRLRGIDREYSAREFGKMIRGAGWEETHGEWFIHSKSPLSFHKGPIVYFHSSGRKAVYKAYLERCHEQKYGIETAFIHRDESVDDGGDCDTKRLKWIVDNVLLGLNTAEPSP
jgi:hypothetical protein